VSGTYYTPVIDITELSGRRLFWKVTTSGTSEIDVYSSEDSVPVIDVRLSNIAPTDGGWASGQLSSDSNWDISTGSIKFSSYDNNHILNPKYKSYFQARLEFHSPSPGETPILEKVGVEEGTRATVPASEYRDIYVKSTYSNHIPDRETNLLVWFFESRNIKQ
jgi:hypothetical protein